MVHGRDGIHGDGAGNIFAACISSHLWVRLPEARNSDCPLHDRYRDWQLAGDATHTPRKNSLCNAVARTQFLLALSVPALILLISLLAKVSGMAATWLAAQCAFPALAALSGILGGYQFPMATRIYLEDEVGRRRLGTLYAIDLLGGCVGALVLSGYLIPVFGFWKTAWLCALVNLAPALLALRICVRQKLPR